MRLYALTWKGALQNGGGDVPGLYRTKAAARRHLAELPSAAEFKIVPMDVRRATRKARQ